MPQAAIPIAAVPLMQVNGWLRKSDSFVATFLKEALYVQLRGITVYAVVLYDLWQGRFLHIKHKLLLFALLNALPLVLGQSLKQHVLSLHFLCFQEMSDNPQRKHSSLSSACA